MSDDVKRFRAIKLNPIFRHDDEEVNAVLESDHVAAMASKNKKIRFLEMVRDDSQKTISQFSKDNDTLTVALVAARVENAKIAKLVNAGKACFPDGKLEDFWGAYDLWNALVEIEGK
ncbi:hypothetical protein UFOVP903_17 [uncultured Caudovirales phage]|uniref:Uncharacterized protein n=1 Tax=uncultured Caudovirales phage TaxID=2100421 RepID=A0A6J5PK80_9CAUD|nr:hypothetical protein UFOVP903_17 [uncultured Caudovirales phage]CAB4197668.1 hypothetical protein UFOVP1318_29 [uncultured Caudovirales phage]CAB4210429.1 hypothetical protein UFOVP1430_15 [uncultured Caudovirales phage]